MDRFYFKESHLSSTFFLFIRRYSFFRLKSHFFLKKLNDFIAGSYSKTPIPFVRIFFLFIRRYSYFRLKSDNFLKKCAIPWQGFAPKSGSHLSAHFFFLFIDTILSGWNRTFFWKKWAILWSRFSPKCRPHLSSDFSFYSDSPIKFFQFEIVLIFFEKIGRFYGRVFLNNIPKRGSHLSAFFFFLFVDTVFSGWNRIFFWKNAPFYGRVLLQKADPICPHIFSFYSPIQIFQVEIARFFEKTKNFMEGF